MVEAKKRKNSSGFFSSAEFRVVRDTISVKTERFVFFGSGT